MTLADVSPAEAAAARWRIAGATARGASHIRRGAPNQDAIRWAEADGAVAVALADGHGGAAHERSEIGSAIAVEVAVDLGLAAAGAGADGRLVERILSEWRSRVRAHAAGDPPAVADEPALLSLYGSTLILAVGTAEALTVLQIGDGDLLVGRTGGAIERPLPDDEGLVGEQTYSLCLPNAAEAARMAVLDASDVDFVMLATDGLSKSFADDADFLKLAAAWRDHARRDGVDELSATLPQWLSNASERGSGDDISLGLILPPAAAGPARVPAGRITRPAATVSAQAPAAPRAGRLAGMPPAAVLSLILLLAITTLAGLVILLDLPLPFGLGPDRT